MSLERLNPGTFIEVDDPVMGGRKIGLVDDTGVGYYDIHGDGELPKPLHSELNPVGLGSIVSWGNEVPASEYEGFVNAWDVLTRRNLDVLTIARAMRWACANHGYDPELLERMGLAETEKILKGREMVASATTRQKSAI